MKKYKMKIQYDGTNFYGFQKQENLPTIEEEIEKALYELLGEEISIVSSGRTDKGVHALGQIIHFECHFKGSPRRFMAGMNRFLPEIIQVVDCEEVSKDFHARFDAKSRIYHYYLYTDYFMPPFFRNLKGHRKYPLDIETMREASKLLIGEMDFSSFTQEIPKNGCVRELYNLDILEKEREILFVFHGKSFLKNMIRIIVGTLIDIGRGKMTIEDLEELIHLKDRGKAGMTVEASGLYLIEVKY